MKKTVLRAAAIAAVLAMAGSASGCYFFPEEEKLLDPPVLKVEDVTYSTYKAVKEDYNKQGECDRLLRIRAAAGLFVYRA